MAKTMANKVRVLMEKSKIVKQAKVPSSDTGTAINGISVDRPLWRNKYTIAATRSSASIKVWITSLIDADTNFVLS